MAVENGKKVLRMAEYIERNKLLHKIRWASDPEDCVMIAKRMPASDVVPVRHGRWILIETDEEQLFFCSECENKEYWESDFCPSCGAKMDGGDKNDE